MQESTTANMIFGVRQLISFISQRITLEPGDIISTGTPSGPALGMPSPIWLTPGDTVRIHMTGLGTMTTAVQQEQR